MPLASVPRGEASSRRGFTRSPQRTEEDAANARIEKVRLLEKEF
jgi:hypothetical protein